jgi:hypothetical protein
MFLVSKKRKEDGKRIVHALDFANPRTPFMIGPIAKLLKVPAQTTRLVLSVFLEFYM